VFPWCYLIKVFSYTFVENGEDCMASDPLKPPTAVVQLQGQTPAKSPQPLEADWFLRFLDGEPVRTCAQAKISAIQI
jgi:hypothetical protein